MRCDDPGGVSAAEQPHRAGSEQLREKEGDKGRKGRRESVRAQTSALFLFTGCTAASPNGIRLQPPPVEEWCSPTPGAVRGASSVSGRPGTYVRHGDRLAYAPMLLRKKGRISPTCSLVAGTKNLIHDRLTL